MSEVKFRTVTVSSMLDSHINGQKRSTFISAVVDFSPGITVEEFRIEHLKAGKEIAIAAVQHALCRMELKEEEARTRIVEIKENYDGFIERLRKKLENKEEVETPF
ncbi:MAG: hypothetical protein ACREHV_16965 [Rhizomicrobium sp.]